jgi:chemotaxis protein histidine kinase CheA
MSASREFFLAEAGDCLGGLEQLLHDDAPFDANHLLRHARALRGSAQMAREEQVARVARSLEAVARGMLSQILAWDVGVRTRVIESVADLRALVEGGEAPDVAERRVAAALARWPEPGIRLPDEARVPDAAAAATAAEPRSAAPAVPPEFLAFAARECAGIVDALDGAVARLEVVPLDREPIKRVLRRLQALLGAAQLDSLPPVAAALRAIDRIARLIAQHNVAVEGEWLAAFAAARDTLKGAVALLEGGKRPGESSALAHLRELWAALDPQYVPAAAPAADAEAPSAPAGGARGGALARALELRPTLERAIGADHAARAALEELFDLIHAGLA